MMAAAGAMRQRSYEERGRHGGEEKRGGAQWQESGIRVCGGDVSDREEAGIQKERQYLAGGAERTRAHARCSCAIRIRRAAQQRCGTLVRRSRQRGGSVR